MSRIKNLTIQIPFQETIKIFSHPLLVENEKQETKLNKSLKHNYLKNILFFKNIIFKTKFFLKFFKFGKLFFPFIFVHLECAMSKLQIKVVNMYLLSCEDWIIILQKCIHNLLYSFYLHFGEEKIKRMEKCQ